MLGIVLLPGIGLSIAVLTLSGQNTGAGNLDRVRETYILSIRYGLYIMIGGGLLIWIFKEPLIGCFTSDPLVVKHGSDYLILAAGSLWAYVVLFNGSSILQGMKRPMFAIWMGLARQIIVPFTLFPLLASWLGMELWGIWVGIVTIAWMAAAFTWWYVKRILHKEILSVESISL